MQRLTAVLLVLLARQGRHGVRRNDGGDHRRPRSRSAALEMQQGFWRRVTRWRGRRRRGGARGYVGEARGRLWVRQRRAVATSSARLSRERDKGGDEHGGRSERARGGAWRRPEGSGRPTKQEVAKRVGARGGHTPSCPLARGGRRQAGSWAGLGQPAGPPAGPPERPGNSLSLSLFTFYFSFCFPICFNSVLI